MRYFIVFYKFRENNEPLFNGMGNASFESNGFPNVFSLIKQLSVGEMENSIVAITNLIEILEADYLNWNRKPTDEEV